MADQQSDKSVPLSADAQDAKELMQQQLLRKMANKMMAEAIEEERQRRIKAELEPEDDTVRRKAFDQLIVVQEDLVRCLNRMKPCSMAMVCRELYVLAQDGFIWRNLFIRNFGRVSAARKDGSKSWKEVYVEQFKLRKEQQRQHRLFALDMMEPPTRPRVVYPPGFGPLDVPGILGGDYDRLPHPFLPPAHIDLRNRQVIPRPRFDPYGPLPGHPRPDELQPFFEPPLLIDRSNRRRQEFSLGRHHGSFGGFRF